MNLDENERKERLIWSGFAFEARHIRFSESTLQYAMRKTNQCIERNAFLISQLNDEELKMLGKQYASEFLK
jgi:hypothetical protein